MSRQPRGKCHGVPTCSELSNHMKYRVADHSSNAPGIRDRDYAAEHASFLNPRRTREFAKSVARKITGEYDVPFSFRAGSTTVTPVRAALLAPSPEITVV